MLVAKLRERDGGIEVLAPAVGWWSGHPRAGSLLAGGSRIGSLHVLNRRYELTLPADVAGAVSGELPVDRRVAVGYGETLFELRPLGGESIGDAAGVSAAAGAQTAAGDGIPVVSPTDGVFYRRPSPTEPPFVEIGGRVHSGQTVGLVESMKTFNQIVFEGDGSAEEGEVGEILCEDAEEVRAGQVLMRIQRPGE